jgi:hypothetical protein
MGSCPNHRNIQLLRQIDLLRSINSDNDYHPYIDRHVFLLQDLGVGQIDVLLSIGCVVTIYIAQSTANGLHFQADLTGA